MKTAKGELVPGGLALVYGLKVAVHDNGKTVELVKLLERNEFFNSPITGDPAMYVGSGGWLCLGDVEDCENPEEKGAAVFHPRNLMPINPEADPLETTQEHEKCQTL